MPNISSLLGSLNKVSPGQSFDSVVTATRINAIQDLLKSLVNGENLISGLGIQKTGMMGGVVISSTAVGGGGGSVTIEHPFEIRDFSIAYSAEPAVTAEAIIQVRFGTLNDITPTDVDTDFSLVTASSTYNVFVKATVGVDGICTAAAVDATTAAVPADTWQYGYLKIGEVDVNDAQVVTEIRQACTHSLRLAMCGRVVDGASLTARGTYEFWGF